MANDCIPYYEPGATITGKASAAITGKRFVMISGNRGTDRSIPVAHATAAGRVFGVSGYDAASGAFLPIIRTPGAVVPVTAGGAIAAFAEVEVGAAGVAVTLAGGRAVGFAVTAATNGTDAEICLY